MSFVTIRSEGALFSDDILKRAASGDLSLGQRASDFGLDGRARLEDEIASCWQDARDHWDSLQRSLKRLKPDESGVTETRNQWALPLLTRLLGFEGLAPARSAALVDGLTFFISHRLGDGDKGLPVHIVSILDNLDKRPESGRPRLSPHGLMQDYLNRTEHVWGLVTNGAVFRIVRNSTRVSRPTYLEFNVEAILASESFAEFSAFYRVVHRSRWPQALETPSECWLERWYQQSIEEGGRVRDKLRDNVEAAIRAFGNGFLRHPENQALRDKVHSRQLSPASYYRQLLRLIYRFIFLMVTEERKLVGPDPKSEQLYRIYRQGYSVTHLRDRVERRFSGQDRFSDLWEGAKQTFRFYEGWGDGEKLGISPLNGDLFGQDAIRDLRETSLSNRDFLKGFAIISLFEDHNVARRINYGYLDVEELGSVYESLLELKPEFTDKLEFGFSQGTERRSTGSYYTPPELVKELIDHALVPVMEERLAAAKTTEERQKALLSLRVCDPACGSGHFLLAAARRIARELAKERSQEDEPPPEYYRHALRDVIHHCLYAVDKNPLAVDLCKVALWIEGHNAGLPLGFLDHHIKCGDSLVGVADLKVLTQGIPDEAFKALAGDAKIAVTYYRKRNRDERDGQASMPLGAGTPPERAVNAPDFDALAALDETTPPEVKAKEALYESLRGRGTEWYDLKVACDLWAYAFFAPKRMPGPDHIDLVPTTDTVRQYLAKPGASHGKLVGAAAGFATDHPCFHWALEFPDVFQAGGFDVVLGNPPFMGGLKISENFGNPYRNYLTATYAPAGGTADICAYFYRGVYRLLKDGSHLGMVSTNTISQGDTRDGGLAEITKSGGAIVFARRFIRWPGAANVEVNLLAIRKGTWPKSCWLDSREVPLISSRLDQESETKPGRLAGNRRRAFQGSIPLGSGFVLDADEAAYLIAKDPRNRECLFPYLVGRDLNSRPDQSPSRWVINFFDWPLHRAQAYPDLLRIVQDQVKPERDRLRDDIAIQVKRKELWWLYGSDAAELYETIKSMERVLVRSQTSEMHAVTHVAGGWVYDQKTVVFAFSDDYHFAILQSSLHEAWVWRYASTLESRNSYTITDCFDTFPFAKEPSLETIAWAQRLGEEYHEHRRQVMLARDLGLTKTYNLFHNQECRDQDIQRLRDLHAQMDQAILACYGWQDLDPGHGFHQNERGQTRYTISPEARREVLRRLLALNLAIAAKESGGKK